MHIDLAKGSLFFEEVITLQEDAFFAITSVLNLESAHFRVSTQWKTGFSLIRSIVLHLSYSEC